MKQKDVCALLRNFEILPVGLLFIFFLQSSSAKSLHAVGTMAQYLFCSAEEGALPVVFRRCSKLVEHDECHKIDCEERRSNLLAAEFLKVFENMLVVLDQSYMSHRTNLRGSHWRGGNSIDQRVKFVSGWCHA